MKAKIRAAWLKALQRGHAFSGVETDRRDSRDADERRLQRGHAFSGVETARRRSAGAVRRARLQRGHAFSGVETPSLRANALWLPPASKGPRLLRRGDVAYSRLLRQQNGNASKGPRLLRRGDRALWRGVGAGALAGFKGATPSQAWRQNERTRKVTHAGSFKGATPSQAWRQSRGWGELMRFVALQRGHAFSGVETRNALPGSKR